MPFAESPATVYRGVRVRLPDGTTRESLSDLAREIGCRPQALRRYIVEHAGGCAVLGGLPDPRRCGPHSPRSKEYAMPDAPPLAALDRLASAHAAALATAQGGAAAAAVEYVVAAIVAARALAGELDAVRADLIRAQRSIALGDLSNERAALARISTRLGVGADPDADRRWLAAHDELDALRGTP
ncbi:MAG TPA: hypothetical protein PKD53_16710 [Chloroflexaceae bacterium]|nr:hypothetical protein [Chloroflexaceae bacterium]